MKAVVQHKYGSLDHLQLAEAPKPVPGPDEVLIRVRAAAVTLSDTITRKGRPLVARFLTGLFRPRQPILGSEFAGVVEAVGQDVTRVEVGDEVLGVTGNACGCFAEFMTMPEDGLLGVKPTDATFPEAASVCGALAAWNFLRDKADVQPGQRVLVNGASGVIGTAAIQVASELGAHVTAVCSTGEVELADSLAPDEVIDETQDDFTKNGEFYDVILDAESTSSYRQCRGSLTRHGIYIRTFPGPVILLQMILTSRIGTKRAIVSATGLMPIEKRRVFLDEITRLVEAGRLRTVIDRCFPWTSWPTPTVGPSATPNGDRSWSPWTRPPLGKLTATRGGRLAGLDHPRGLYARAGLQARLGGPEQCASQQASTQLTTRRPSTQSAWTTIEARRDLDSGCRLVQTVKTR